MWRHTWFKILVGLQLVNFAAMVLIEQQRRTIWNKEATNAQKILDIKTFSEKTETDVRYVARQLEDIRRRLDLLQQESAENVGVAAQLRDARERLTLLQQAAAENTGVAAQLRDARERLTLLQQAAAENTGVAAQLQDARERLTLLQQEAAKNAAVAALLKDARDRVMSIEATLRKTQGAK